MDRVAVVTGGTGGLGRWVVKSLLEDGFHVSVPWISEPEAAELDSFLGGSPPPLELTPADVSDAGQAERHFHALHERAGRLDALVNLVGGFVMGGVEETEPAMWARMVELNATTAFLCSRAAVGPMRQTGGGRIVNIVAFPAFDRGAPSMSAYAAAKAAVLNLTYSLSKELQRSRITVNAVAPQIIDTPANRRDMPDADTAKWLSPLEIAGVIRFLLGRDAACVTGALLPLTKG